MYKFSLVTFITEPTPIVQAQHIRTITKLKFHRDLEYKQDTFSALYIQKEQALLF